MAPVRVSGRQEVRRTGWGVLGRGRPAAPCGSAAAPSTAEPSPSPGASGSSGCRGE